MRFFLGTHMTSWLQAVQVPLFISHRRLARHRRLKPAACDWSLDSGGFTELSMHGEWRTTLPDYVAAVRRYRDEVGRMQWAAPQDAMCEPWILEKSRAWLGGTVEAHQRWTVDNYLRLRDCAPDLPFIPVLQGWQVDDYWRQIDLYERAGIDLTAEPVVGLGSVCRRQATSEIASLVGQMSSAGLRLHGFGVKTSGLASYGMMLESADSLAWSFGGRRVRPCPVSHRGSCANCLHHALAWRERVLERSDESEHVEHQFSLPFGRNLAAV